MQRNKTRAERETGNSVTRACRSVTRKSREKIFIILQANDVMGGERTAAE